MTAAIESRSGLYDFAYARQGPQLEQMLDLDRRGVCIFCPEGLPERAHPIRFTVGGWLLTENDYPYQDRDGSEVRSLLLVPIAHVTGRDLTLDERSELFEVVNWAVDRFDIEGGGLIIRFGDTAMTGATIKHLHAHLIVPNVDPETGRAVPVYFPIG